MQGRMKLCLRSYDEKVLRSLGVNHNREFHLNTIVKRCTDSVKDYLKKMADREDVTDNLQNRKVIAKII